MNIEDRGMRGFEKIVRREIAVKFQEIVHVRKS